MVLLRAFTKRLLYYVFITMNIMSKYNPLWQYFQNRNEGTINISFDEIQDILEFAIDHSFLNYKKELELYGYRVKKIYLKEKRIAFEKKSRKLTTTNKLCLGSFRRTLPVMELCFLELP